MSYRIMYRRDNDEIEVYHNTIDVQTSEIRGIITNIKDIEFNEERRIKVIKLHFLPENQLTSISKYVVKVLIKSLKSHYCEKLFFYKNGYYKEVDDSGNEIS